jgi:DsbC/DsbD-like thiol-disulfide interchange protein
MRQEILLGVAALLAAQGTVAAAQEAGGRHVRASLVAEADAVEAGQPLRLGFRLEMEPGWHTYWRNPGDSGLPTSVQWELPEGFTAGELQWPRPIRFATGPLVSYGYEHEVLHPVEIRVPASLEAGDVHLAARLSWLECQDVCLPGKAQLTLTLPVRARATPGPAAPLFAEARRHMPRGDPAWRLGATAREGAIDLVVHPPSGTTLSEAYFYPVTRRILDYSKPQTLARGEQGYRIELVRDPNGAPSVGRLTGVLVTRTPDGEEAIEVDVPVKRPAEARQAGDSLSNPEEGRS